MEATRLAAAEEILDCPAPTGKRNGVTIQHFVKSTRKDVGRCLLLAAARGICGIQSNC
jgi:hypothetical protein